LNRYYKNLIEDTQKRFWDRIDKNGPTPAHRPDLGPCWIWKGCCSIAGYGKVRLRRQGFKTRNVHTISFLLSGKRIKRGLVPDHLCRVKRCVNPRHIEAVTQQVNTLRGFGISAQNARKTHCKRGHAFVGNNIMWVPGGRSCKECHRNKTRLAMRKCRAV
jgi:hypothetical protein